ncbi:hypothetical protein ACLK1T_03425 [Escherichia coli]
MKQQAGFSQTSQIHKRQPHQRARRLCTAQTHEQRLYDACLHPARSIRCFAALDINAKMHEGVSSSNMWMDCVVNGINARKLILDNCQHIRRSYLN